MNVSLIAFQNGKKVANLKNFIPAFTNTLSKVDAKVANLKNFIPAFTNTLSKVGNLQYKATF